MADFNPIFVAMIGAEGGYVLHKVSGDSGGWTYAGVSRANHQMWPGWQILDTGVRSSPELSRLVREFYLQEFWMTIRGDELPQETANMLFSFAVNASPKTAIKLAQSALGCAPDGVIGPKTLAVLVSTPSELFKQVYFIAMITRYAEICNKKPSQKKFLHGWVNRALGLL